MSFGTFTPFPLPTLMQMPRLELPPMNPINFSGGSSWNTMRPPSDFGSFNAVPIRLQTFQYQHTSFSAPRQPVVWPSVNYGEPFSAVPAVHNIAILTLRPATFSFDLNVGNRALPSNWTPPNMQGVMRLPDSLRTLETMAAEIYCSNSLRYSLQLPSDRAWQLSQNMPQLNVKTPTSFTLPPVSFDHPVRARADYAPQTLHNATPMGVSSSAHGALVSFSPAPVQQMKAHLSNLVVSARDGTQRAFAIIGLDALGIDSQGQADVMRNIVDTQMAARDASVEKLQGMSAFAMAKVSHEVWAIAGPLLAGVAQTQRMLPTIEGIQRPLSTFWNDPTVQGHQYIDRALGFRTSSEDMGGTIAARYAITFHEVGLPLAPSMLSTAGRVSNLARSSQATRIASESIGAAIKEQCIADMRQIQSAISLGAKERQSISEISNLARSLQAPVTSATAIDLPVTWVRDIQGLKATGLIIEESKPLTAVAAEVGAIKQWNPAYGQGPLKIDHVTTFRSATYIQYNLQESVILYRVYSDPSKALGKYWTRIAPSGPLQSIMDSALKHSWGNRGTHIIKIKVPPGTTVFEGVVAPQGGLLGGGNQIFIENIELSG